MWAVLPPHYNCMCMYYMYVGMVSDGSSARSACVHDFVSLVTVLQVCVEWAETPGVMSAISRTLGSIPSPLITGAVFESACLLWEKDECGLQGNCAVYNNYSLGIRTMFVFTLFLICSTMFSFLAWLNYPKSWGGQEQSRRNGGEGDRRVLVDSCAEDEDEEEDEENSSLTQRDT